MVLMRRQTSQTGNSSVDLYSDYDTPIVNSYQKSKSESSMYEDPELRFVDDFFRKDKGSSKATELKKNFFWVIQYIVFIVIAFNAWKTNEALEKATKELSQVEIDYTFLEGSLIETEAELSNAHSDFNKLKLAFDSAQPSLGYGVQQKEGRRIISDTLLERHDAQAERISALQEHIQKENLLDLRRRYGAGPYQIEVVVNVQNKRKVFIMETAPIDLMPHAIHTFMDLVENDVWKETMFIHKVEHVVLAAPIDTEGNQKSPEIAKTLLFPEYSPEFPHVMNTIGFQGRPGGPELYINLDDNSEYHGPGGQQHHDLVEEADPCFAKVISGFEVLQDFNMMNKKASSEDQIYYSKIETMMVRSTR